MRRIEGKVALHGTVAYAPQNPWQGASYLSPVHLFDTADRLMGATIRDNILFSHEYDEAFYNLVLDGACRKGRRRLCTLCIHYHPFHSVRASSRLGALAQR
jgi:hypothetical protein